MGRILAIDYGRKKSGVAVTDPMQIIANGLTTVSSHELFDFIVKYMQDEEVEKIVVGYPTQTTGEVSESMKYIEPFVNRLKKNFPDLPVEWVDERFTSKIAFQAMIDGGLKKKARRNKAMIDKVSATIILQTYLEQKHI
ncbi:Holliday junction resolvase RuvX [Carboxylicivirga mesophila]|uniref:Putative pre-16S rRNA nuclease n=1 Tax=Carboxylicivirga mesophila TaxID=1166478 RepID=A0ABS5K904_9BACT|nr:Holliday junction resolvase RuvX [Carboxylicivirga mesophila]MBS2211483.1 Holliday junction resolvase RuvX [Carboxylicivirga mesophila]